MGYESDLRKAMEYVFGSTLVCDTLDNAKKVAFDKQVMTKTVTLGGDIFDPQGTLSGGENKDNTHTHVCNVTTVTVFAYCLSASHHTIKSVNQVYNFLFLCQVLVPSPHQSCLVCRS